MFKPITSVTAFGALIFWAVLGTSPVNAAVRVTDRSAKGSPAAVGNPCEGNRRLLQRPTAGGKYSALSPKLFAVPAPAAVPEPLCMPPEYGDYDSWNRLTDAEKRFVIAHPFAAKAFQAAASKALTDAQSRFPSQCLHNGTGDAFRHAYWNALMVRAETEALAQEFADAHESNPDQPQAEREMDLHNNQIGRWIARDNPNATEAQIIDLVMNALNNGQLSVMEPGCAG
jgi:hypothetical protein